MFKALWKWLCGLFRRKEEPPKPALPPEPPTHQVQIFRRGRLGALGMQTSPQEIQTRIPRKGDRVWWAPKQLWCEIDRVDMDTMNFAFIGGEPVRTSDGKIVPRWTVSTGMGGHHFDEKVNAWIVGRGLLPKNIRGKIITPEPIKMKINASTGEVTKHG